MAFVGRTLIRNFSAAAAEGHAGGSGSKTWKILTFLVALPGVAITGINAYLGETEHMKHYTKPPFIPYDHLRLRTKKFPWGDGNHTLFHNPKMNPLPEGWEDEGS